MTEYDGKNVLNLKKIKQEVKSNLQTSQNYYFIIIIIIIIAGS